MSHWINTRNKEEIEINIESRSSYDTVYAGPRLLVEPSGCVFRVPVPVFFSQKIKRNRSQTKRPKFRARQLPFPFVNMVSGHDPRKILNYLINLTFSKIEYYAFRFLF